MKTLELKKLGTPELYKMGLVEMNTEEQQAIDGGFLESFLGVLKIVAEIVGVIVTIVEGIKKIGDIINGPEKSISSSGGGGRLNLYSAV